MGTSKNLKNAGFFVAMLLRITRKVDICHSKRSEKSMSFCLCKKFLKISCGIFFLLLFLAGCGKTVDVIQADQFKIMADRMYEELIARDILDTSRAYVSGTWGDAEDYGPLLYQRLKPDFLFEDIVSVLPGSNFAASVKPSDTVKQYPLGFSIQRAWQKITVNMIAITDWDGDGTKDWLISCLVDNMRQQKKRDYYLVIADASSQMASQGALQGTVVAVYEITGHTGRLYLRESKAALRNAAPDANTPLVEEAVPGLRTITTPPTTEKRNGIQERTL